MLTMLMPVLYKDLVMFILLLSDPFSPQHHHPYHLDVP